GEQVIALPLDFSIGPITQIDEQVGVEKHFSWMEAHFNQHWWDIRGCKEGYEASLTKLRALNDGTRVTIWTCRNASEQVGLQLVLYLLRERALDLYVVNTYEAMQLYEKEQAIQFDLRHTGECSSDQLLYFYRHAHERITEESRRRLEELGEQLLQSEQLVRSWKDGK